MKATYQELSEVTSCDLISYFLKLILYVNNVSCIYLQIIHRLIALLSYDNWLWTVRTKLQGTTNFIRTLRLTPEPLNAVPIRVFKTLAAKWLHLSRCSNSSHFESTAAIFITRWLAISRVDIIKCRSKHHLITVAGVNFCLSFCFWDLIKTFTISVLFSIVQKDFRYRSNSR